MIMDGLYTHPYETKFWFHENSGGLGVMIRRIVSQAGADVTGRNVLKSKEERQFLVNLKKKNTGALTKYIVRKANEDPLFDINAVVREGFLTDQTGDWNEAESTVLRLHKIYCKFPGRLDLSLVRLLGMKAGNFYRLAHIITYFPQIKFTKSDIEIFAEAFEKNPKEKFAEWHLKVLRENLIIKRLFKNSSVMDLVKTIEVMEA